MGLHFVYDDICKSECDIIVNAANGIGFMGGFLGRYIKFSGVSENINYATKGKVENEAIITCIKHFIIGYMPGNIYVTNGYNLNCKYIMHAVTMWLPGTFSSLKIIKKLLPKIIYKTKELKLHSIAIPLLGTGVGRVKPDKVLELYREFFEYEKEIDVYVYLLKKK